MDVIFARNQSVDVLYHPWRNYDAGENLLLSEQCVSYYSIYIWRLEKLVLIIRKTDFLYPYVAA